MRQRYPDPSRVPYPTTQPPGFSCQLTTNDAGRNVPMHSHGSWLNEQGDGNTDVAAGHFHRVRNFVVQADQSDGHTHQMTMLPCGAGGAHNVGRDGQRAMTPFLGAAEGEGGPIVMAPRPSRGISPWAVGIGLVVIAAAVVVAVKLMREGES